MSGQPCSTSGKKNGYFIKGISKPQCFFIMALCLLTLVPSMAFCDDINFLDTMGTSLKGLLFGTGMRTVVLVFGAIVGVYKAVSSGQFWPLLTWGGIGCVVAFIPSAISFMAAM